MTENTEKEKVPTLEQAVTSLSAVNFFCQQMEEILTNDDLEPARKLRKVQIVHHQLREVAEEWA
jgi:hypothetical protein